MCRCTSSSCGAGRFCSGGSCSVCAAGERCNCPSGYEADGSGGCRSSDKCLGVTCSSGKRCDSSTGTCVNCALGQDCGCSDYGKISNGTGGCKSSDPCSGVSCPAGQKCSLGACVNCPNTEVCGCSAGKYADAAGGCKCKAPTPDWDGTKCYLDTCKTCQSFEYCKDNKCVLQVGKCYTTADCATEHYCLLHACVPGCENDADCNAPKNCYGGVCKTACEHLSPCTDPKYPKCYSSWHGAAGHEYGYYCKCSSSSCGEGLECRSNDYINNTPDSGLCKAPTCSTDADCDAPKNCYGGVCKTACEHLSPCTDPKYPKCYSSWHGAAGHEYGYYCKCSSSSCGEGYTCDSNISYSSNIPDSGMCKVARTETCTTDADCSAEKRCSDGWCVFRE